MAKTAATETVGTYMLRLDGRCVRLATVVRIDGVPVRFVDRIRSKASAIKQAKALLASGYKESR